MESPHIAQHYGDVFRVSLEVVPAREWTVADIEDHRVPRPKRNDYIVKTGQVLTKEIGADRTTDVQVAWTSLLDSRADL